MKWFKKVMAGYALIRLLIEYFGYLKDINVKLDALADAGTGATPFTAREIEVMDIIFDKGEELVGKVMARI